MRFRLRGLEERIVYDAAAVGDVSAAFGAESTADIADSDSQNGGNEAIFSELHTVEADTGPADNDAEAGVEVTSSVVVDLQIGDSDGLRVLVVSSEVADLPLLMDAALDNVIIVSYDASTDSLSDIYNMITESLNGEQADSIAFVNHGDEATFTLTDKFSVNTDTLVASPELGQFWQSIGQNIKDGGRVDLLACNLAATAEGIQLLQMIDTFVDGQSPNHDVSIAASTDLTANETQGGDWVLEYGAVDAAGTYFNTEALSQWNSTLLTFTVDTIFDTVDVVPGDGIAADGSGDTSLRAAVMEANALGGAHTIILPAGDYQLTFGDNNEDGAIEGDLDIAASADITIVGDGAGQSIVRGLPTLMGEVTLGPDRVFHVLPQGMLTLQNLTVTDGHVNEGIAVENFLGGGIFNQGTLALLGTEVTGNRTSGQLIGGGGGIANDGVLTISNSMINMNTTDGAGGGLYNRGGSVIINMSSFNGNMAADVGGGIVNTGTMTMFDSTVDGNQARDGGGIYIFGVGSIFRSTISNNTAAVVSGGIAVSGSLTMVNSTVSGNMGSTGGGVVLFEFHNPTEEAGSLDIRHSTIVNNMAEEVASGIAVTQANAPTPVSCEGNCNTGPGLGLQTPQALVNHTILANVLGRFVPNTEGVSSTGFNLLSDGAINNVQVSDLLNTAPGVGPLADNGGPTLTHLPLDGSAAIDSGDPGFIPGPVTDQRGVPRVQGLAIERGSVEVPGPVVEETLEFHTHVHELLEVAERLVNPSLEGTVELNNPDPYTRWVNAFFVSPLQRVIQFFNVDHEGFHTDEVGDTDPDDPYGREKGDFWNFTTEEHFNNLDRFINYMQRHVQDWKAKLSFLRYN